MKVAVPVEDVDFLLTREDFVKKVEECVNSENARIIGVALHNVVSTNTIAAKHIYNVLKMAQTVYMYDPELSTKMVMELSLAAASLARITLHFETEKAVAEAVNAVKH